MIAFIIGVVRYQKLATPFQILTYSLLATIILEIFAKILAIKFKNNALAYHLMGASGYVFYSLVYYFLFINKKLKRIILLSIFPVVLFFFINLFFLQQPSQAMFPTNFYLLTNTLFVILSLLLFKQMLQHSSQVTIVKQSIFWFNTAILFFSATMFLNMGLLNYYVTYKWGYDIVYAFWEGNFCLLNVLISISLLIDKKDPYSIRWVQKT